MSDMNDREDGLFPESEPPKRENPYLRKNKQKPQKPPREPKPKKETRASKPAAADAPGADDPAEEATTYRNPRRGLRQFFYDHVKLITAVLTASLVISLVVITDLDNLVIDMVNRIEQGDKQPLTMDYVRALSEKNGPIVWQDLEDFSRYNESDATDSLTWFFKVKGTNYEVWISGSGTRYTPTYVHLYDMTTGAELDLNKGDLDAFLNGTSP